MARKCKATPPAFAKHDCANFGADGWCLGIVPESLAPGAAEVKAHRPGPCVLCEETPRRCGYFEKCVLPLANWPSPKDNPKLQEWRLRARDAYRTSTGRRPGRKCRDCGGPMPGDAKPNKLYCDKCAEARRRRQFRAEKRRQRGSGSGVLQSAGANPHEMGPEEGYFSKTATKGLMTANSAD